jgi:hypothetical protein
MARSARRRLGNRELKAIQKAAAAPSGDIAVGLSEVAIQKFLDAHFRNNADFYDRSRERLPNNPIYEFLFNDHGTRRRARFWAKVTKPGGASAVAINLHVPSARRQRFAAWWRKAYGRSGAAGSLPHNVGITIAAVILQVNFPKLDGSNGEHQIDLSFRIEIETFVKIVQENAVRSLQLINWDIRATPNDDPIDPNNPIWGGDPQSPCVQEVKRLRLVIRDLFTIGANVVLTELGETLTQTLPLPPIDIIQGISVDPTELVITNDTLAIGFAIKPESLQERVTRLFNSEMQRFWDDLGDANLSQIMSKGPLDDPAALNRYMLRAVPAYAALEARSRTIRNRHRTPPSSSKRNGRLTASDLFVSVNRRVFDVVAKSLLRADKRDCTDWLRIDLLAFYGEGRACYWFSLKNAHGDLNGTTVSMGCDFSAGGGLELKACIRIPCHSDECASWSPGLGLEGPCTLDVRVDTTNWSGNKALKLRAQFSSFPGFHVYGLPPGIDELVNAVLNFLTSVALQAFFNALLSVLDIYLIQVQDRIPEANVSLRLSNFGASNSGGALVITGTTTFS